MFKRLFLLMCILVIIMIPLVSSFAMDGLVGAWLFDEGSGNKVKDASGRSHDGELVGKATFDKNGKIGSAIICDGPEAYVKIPDHADFIFKGDFSMGCWFLNNGVAPADNSGIITKGYHTIPANGGDAKPWYLVYFMKAGPVDMFLRDTKAVNSRAVGKTLVNDGKWHHVLGMKAGNKVKIYIDGKEDGVADAVDANYGESAQPLVFMVHYDRWIKGMIDEVAIFNKALTDKEISTVMSGLKLAFAVDSKGKLAFTWGQLKS
ncbi:MAG: LamG domain-containing protein [Candidatus Poribacteria bacterium]